jgi:hypothetical protein
MVVNHEHIFTSLQPVTLTFYIIRSFFMKTSLELLKRYDVTKTIECLWRRSSLKQLGVRRLNLIRSKLFFTQDRKIQRVLGTLEGKGMLGVKVNLENKSWKWPPRALRRPFRSSAKFCNSLDLLQNVTFDFVKFDLLTRCH